MILIPGVSRCPVCGRPVYPTDDLFTILPLAPEPGEPLLQDGHYHYRCFRQMPFADAHLADLRPGLEEGLGPPDDRTVLGRTTDFVVTRETYDDDEYRLHALAHGRWLELTKEGLVGVLTGLMSGASNDRVRIEPTTDGGASVFVASAVPVRAEFRAPDFARIAPLLPRLGPRPSAERVNVGELCELLGITPMTLTCPLTAATGSVLRTAEDGPGAFTLLADRWQEIDLTAEQFAQLKELAEPVLLAL